MTETMTRAADKWAGVKFTRSTLSDSGGGGNCVEIAFATDGTVGVRDSKQEGQGPVLEFAPAEWDAFLGGVKAGEFDRG